MKKGKWIWIDNYNKSDEYLIFLDEFEAYGNVIGEISVSGDYAMYVNGQLAAFGQYADYADYKIYDRIDLSKYVKSGKNTLRIIAWYIGADFSTCRKMQSGLLYEIFDNNKTVAYSKAGTKCAYENGYVSYRRKTITAQLGFSYTYDFGRACTPLVWRDAIKTQAFKQLYIRPNQKLRLEPCVDGVLIDVEKNIYDLGCERSGLLSIRFCSESGARVIIGYGEHIADGKVRDYIDGRDFTVELIADGKTDEFLGTFRRLGCRYLQVQCDKKIVIEHIGLCESVYPLQKIPFKADSELHEKIYKVAERTLELCLHEHYEDCPWREQAMYIMDTRSQMLCGYYAFNNPECAKSAIQLILQGQKDNGLFELCFPARVPITIPSFSLMLPIMVLEYTHYTNVLEIAQNAFDKLEKMCHYFLSKLDERNLFKTISGPGIWHFYEWAGDLDGAFFSTDDTKKIRNGYDSLINAFIAMACGAMCDLSALLSIDEKKRYYADKKKKINAAIFSTFYNEKDGVFLTYEGKKDESALANALCILSGACPSEKIDVIAEKLIQGWDDWVENTLSMDKFRYDALLMVDKDKYGPMILADIDKKYSYMLEQGATSFWETIKGQEDFSLAGSLCHGWSALPVYYYRILIKNN